MTFLLFFYARKRILMNNSPMISKDDYIHIVTKHIQKLITPLEFEEYIYIDFNQNNDLMLSIDIDKGGASGGSYMGHSAHGYSGYVKNDPDFYNVIYDILSDMNHNGSYCVISDAIKTCQSKKRREEREYYGNYSVREIIKFDFMKFYSFLYP